MLHNTDALHTVGIYALMLHTQGPYNYIVQNASFCLSKINDFVQNAVFCPRFSRPAAIFQNRNIALILIYSCVMLI